MNDEFMTKHEFREKSITECLGAVALAVISGLRDWSFGIDHSPFSS